VICPASVALKQQTVFTFGSAYHAAQLNESFYVLRPPVFFMLSLRKQASAGRHEKFTSQRSCEKLQFRQPEKQKTLKLILQGLL
jgi:hypothetical protein